MAKKADWPPDAQPLALTAAGLIILSVMSKIIRESDNQLPLP